MFRNRLLPGNPGLPLTSVAGCPCSAHRNFWHCTPLYMSRIQLQIVPSEMKITTIQALLSTNQGCFWLIIAHRVIN